MQTTGKERRRTAKRTSRERWWMVAERRTAVDGAGTVKGKAGWPRGGKAVCCADDRQGTATNGKADIKRTLVDGGRAKNGGGRRRNEARKPYVTHPPIDRTLHEVLAVVPLRV